MTLLLTFIQEFGPKKTHAAWSVIWLGAGLAVLVAAPLFVMFLFRRARLREQRGAGNVEIPQIDPWIEAGKRMTDHIDPTDDDEQNDQQGDEPDTGPEFDAGHNYDEDVQ